MHIKSTKAKKIIVDEGVIFDYPMPNEELGISYQILHGRCPVKGRYLNTKVHEIYFIISGSATFFLGSKKFTIGKNDIIIVKPNTPHHLENVKNLKFITITRPNWYPEQYKLIE